MALDPNKIAETLGVPWRHPANINCEIDEEEPLTGIYSFRLGLHGEKSLELEVRPKTSSDDWACVVLLFPMANKYESKLMFSNIAKVVHHPEYHLVEFKRVLVGDDGEEEESLKVWGDGRASLL